MEVTTARSTRGEQPALVIRNAALNALGSIDVATFVRATSNTFSAGQVRSAGAFATPAHVAVVGDEALSAVTVPRAIVITEGTILILLAEAPDIANSLG